MNTRILFLLLAVRAIAALHGAERELPSELPPELSAPYDPEPEHLWNRLHRALFMRKVGDKPVIHTVDPFLFEGGTFLLQGESHKRAIAVLDEFLGGRGEELITSPVKRAVLLHDLWAAFDYAAWVVDDWVYKSGDESAAIALRTRLAQIIKRLRPSPVEIQALPDTFALAVQSKAYPAEYDAQHPEKPFLPPDLFDGKGPWVRVHDQSADAIAPEHNRAVRGRSAHLVYLRLPGGRAATLDFIKKLTSTSIAQFPTGTMAALVRRALTIDNENKIRVSPLTELVQIRVYKRIPENPEANLAADFGEQDTYEFKLNQAALFSGKVGLKPVDRDESEVVTFDRSSDPFGRRDAGLREMTPLLNICIGCHQAPGVHSVLSLKHILNKNAGPFRGFYSYTEEVELSYTTKWKAGRFDWGLLQGLLEK